MTTNNGIKKRQSDIEAAISEADAAIAPEMPPPAASTPADDEDKETASSAGLKSIRRRRSVSVSVRGLIVGAVILALTAAAATLGWLYINMRHQVDAMTTRSANDAHAERIALDYAVNAATMDFKDLQAWKVKLVAGTSPELSKKLSDAGTSMEQVLVPLQWSSSAQPLVAKVRSTTGGVYIVDSFVSVQTKTAQAPEALQSTATYSTTIDSNNNWVITDVGGIGSAMGQK